MMWMSCLIQRFCVLNRRGADQVGRSHLIAPEMLFRSASLSLLVDGFRFEDSQNLAIAFARTVRGCLSFRPARSGRHTL